jgi:hypothetical protein
MSAKFLIPRSYEDVHNQCLQTVNYLNENLEALGISGKSAEWVTTTFKANAWQPYAAAYADWLNPAERTPLKITAMKNAYDVLMPVYRELYAFLKNNPALTDSDLLAMGFPPRSTGKYSLVPPPSTVPEATVELPSEATVTVHFRDKGATKRAKPEGIAGAEILWTVADAPAARWEELTQSAFDTATPYTFSFSGSERGKTLSFALRWQNTKGEKGNLSSIYTAIVP